MNEEDKISKNLLIIMFISCIILLVAIICAIMVNSPKYIGPALGSEIVPQEDTYLEGENPEETASEVQSSAESSSAAENKDIFPIGINSATEEELDLIPRIGPATAKRIIDYRNEHGTIISFDELLSISGIGEKTIEILKEYCIIN